MQLTTLVEEVRDYLNENVDLWTSESVKAKVELDPLLCMLDNLGVYIIPVFDEYLIDKSPRRGSIKALYTAHNFNLIVSKVFKELPQNNTDGVANWSEAKPLVDTRSIVEKLIIKGYSSPGVKFIGAEPLEIQEIEMDNRNFVALTTFIYEDVECVT